MPSATVLVTGASGYLGQHLCVHLAAQEHVAVVGTYASNPSLVPDGVTKVQANLATGEGLASVAAAHTFTHVVNCAAISQPKACEDDEAFAMALNVPTHALALANRQGAAFIHISTDQVYDGTRALSDEDTEVAPVNAYGRSKVAAEQHIAENAAGRHVCFRSSIIYGPEPPKSVNRGLFLQFCRKAVAEATEPFTFFHDEYRNPVYVSDICRIVGALVHAPSWPLARPVYCMGGPDRLSRVDFARRVAALVGASDRNIEEVSAASVDRGVASPADISMNSARLFDELKLAPTPFDDGARASLGV